jgi:hypothetical protein
MTGVLRDIVIMMIALHDIKYSLYRHMWSLRKWMSTSVEITSVEMSTGAETSSILCDVKAID